MQNPGSMETSEKNVIPIPYSLSLWMFNITEFCTYPDWCEKGLQIWLQINGAKKGLQNKIIILFPHFKFVLHTHYIVIYSNINPLHL